MLTWQIPRRPVCWLVGAAQTLSERSVLDREEAPGQELVAVR
jgi:hypothetical protein